LVSGERIEISSVGHRIKRPSRRFYCKNSQLTAGSILGQLLESVVQEFHGLFRVFIPTAVFQYMPRGRIAHRLTQRLVRVEPADQAGELQVVLRVAEDETGFPLPDQFTGPPLA